MKQKFDYLRKKIFGQRRRRKREVEEEENIWLAEEMMSGEGNGEKHLEKDRGEEWKKKKENFLEKEELLRMGRRVEEYRRLIYRMS